MNAATPALPLGTGLAGVVGDLCGAVEVAAPRVARAEDAEGLHDLRVALRRLRVFLKAYRAFPEARVKRRVLQPLRDLARTTGAARDLQVTLAWLDSAPAPLPPTVAQWHADLDGELAAARRRLVRSLDRRIPPLLVQLRDTGLAMGRRKAESGGFAAVTAQRLRKEEARLARELGAITDARQAEAIHRARITGKRTRYLLTPWRGLGPGCAEAEAACKRLQGVLGDIHDCHVRVALLAGRAAAEGAALGRARVLAVAHGDRLPADAAEALLELAAGSRRQLDRLFTAAQQEFLADGGSALLAAVARACRELEARRSRIAR